MRNLEARTAVLSIVGLVTFSAPALAQVGDPAGTYPPPDHTAPAPGVEDPTPPVGAPNGAYEETPETTRILVSGMIEKVMDEDDNERLAIASPDQGMILLDTEGSNLDLEEHVGESFTIEGVVDDATEMTEIRVVAAYPSTPAEVEGEAMAPRVQE